MRIKTLALLLALPILAACAGSSDSGASAPVPLISATSADSRSEARLLIPANIPPGAASAVFDYFRLLNMALETGRTAELEDSVAWDCPCLTPVAAIKAIFRAGLLTDAKFRIERISLVATSGSTSTIQVESVRSAAIQFIRSSGARIALAEHRNTTDFIVEDFGAIWLIMSSRIP